LIESFVDATTNLESPEIFRKWAAIGSIAATLEQKVWLQTSSALYPNLYVFLVAHPGVGKTRTVRAVKRYFTELPEPHIAPTSVTASSLVDALVKAKRTLIRMPEGPLEYNSLLIAADELTAFMHKYDDEMIGVLSAFYDNDQYGQHRRGNEIRISIKSPQVNILSGTTPSNLIKFLPENAWEQGFTSRIILVFSDERTIGDDFAEHDSSLNGDLIHDLKAINSLMGEFKVTEDYRTAVNHWRSLGEPPVPNHPKLIHYATRRRVHLYKLSMVAAVDRSDTLLLTREDFNRAMGWLLEAEVNMPDIFKAGGGGADAKAMDEIYHFILVSDRGRGVPEHKITNFARERVPIHSILRVIDVMERSGMIRAVALDPKTKQRLYQAQVPDLGREDLP